MLTVKSLAQKADVTPHTIRHYVTVGILNPQRDPQNNYQLFNAKDVSRVQFVRQAQQLGFSLQELVQIFEDIAAGKSACPRVRDILRCRIDENRRKLDALLRLQQRMEKALLSWENLPDGVPNGNSVCTLIEGFE